MRFFSYALLMVGLLGCAGSPMRIVKMPASKLSTIPTVRLVQTCEAYPKTVHVITELEKRRDLKPNYAKKCPELLYEFAKRGDIRREYVPLIKKQQISLGMTIAEMKLSWGKPQYSNRSVGSWGVHTQHVYGDLGPYVYTKDGIITSWQY